MIRSYSDLIALETFEERFNYLRLNGQVGSDTFGFDRYLNQAFYKSPEWKKVRQEVILRDNGCDLGVLGYELNSRIIIHHMNPISIEDVLNRKSEIFNPEFLICTSHQTHNALHYGADARPLNIPIERTPNDMCPWRK